MRKLNLLLCVILLGSTANAKTFFYGITTCNKIHEPIIITCNNHAAPPVFNGGCLPITWKAMATNPIFFGGGRKNPLMHLDCQWTTKQKGDPIMSTVIDLFDDGSNTYAIGKLSNVMVSDNYIANTIPNPLPGDYTTTISVEFKKK